MKKSLILMTSFLSLPVATAFYSEIAEANFAARRTAIAVGPRGGVVVARRTVVGGNYGYDGYYYRSLSKMNAANNSELEENIVLIPEANVTDAHEESQ